MDTRHGTTRRKSGEEAEVKEWDRENKTEVLTKQRRREERKTVAYIVVGHIETNQTKGRV